MQRHNISAGDRYMQLLNIAETLESDEAIAAFLLAKRLIAKTGGSFRELLLPITEWPLTESEHPTSRLVKILCLIDSDKEGESIAAFLMARNIMKRCGLAFHDILISPKLNNDEVGQSYYPLIDFEVITLRNRLRNLHLKVTEQEGELKRYRAAFDELMDASWALHYDTKPKNASAHPPLLN